MKAKFMMILGGAVSALAATVIFLAGLAGNADAQSATYSETLFKARNTAVTESFNTSALDLVDYDTLAIQYGIDQGTSVNTMTIKLQHSLNGYEWIDKATLLSSSASDTGAITQTTRTARYSRLAVTLANSNPVTFTVLAGLAE